MNNSWQIKKVTWIGLYINLALSALKFTAGILGKSQAVIADAVHSLSDMTTDFAILIGLKYWDKPPDESHPHGHQRIETLITALIGVILASVATGILWNVITTLHEKHESHPGWVAFWAAAISIIVKEILYKWTVHIGIKIRSMPLVANAWHHRSDALSSIPVAIAVAVAIIHPTWYFLDHLGAVIVAIFIYQASFKIVYPSLNKLTDSSASKSEISKIRDIVISTDNVKGVHKIRTRYIGSSSLSVDLHIEVDPKISVQEGHLISENVKSRLISSDLSIVDVIVHLEPRQEIK